MAAYLKFSQSKQKEKVSVVIVALNEEARITKCLDSVKWADEIIVVDSGSRDHTRNIARQYTAEVFQREFDDYATQKNFGADQASYNWIFSIDADEVVTPQLEAEIQNTLLSAIKEDMYSIPRQNIYFGHPIRYVFGKDRPVRLYRRDKARFAGSVHEKVIGGMEGQLHSLLIHYSCNSYREWVSKHRHYIRLSAAEEYRKGRRFSLYRCIFSPLRVLLFRSFILQGWRDGWPGLRIAFEMAISSALFHIELRRLSESSNKALV